MKISVNAVRFINEHFGSAGNPAPNGIDDLVEKIGAQLGAVEEIIPFGKRFEGVVVVKIVACEDHPNADRLHVCKIDDGGRVENIDRDEQGFVTVVCGAPNVREGLTVAWLPPGSTVPSTYDKDPFVLESRELRGVISNGMLASPKELSLSDNHDGILEVDGDIVPGMLFAEAYHLTDDVIIDMENKMFTHRPDCFGWLGIAREIEGIYNRPYKSPEWYRINPTFPDIETDELPLEVHNELPELVPRFTAITLRDITVGTSPIWLQADLARVGLRPINNIVDYTNFFMIETGQPLHAYDYDKVKALSDVDHAVITVRYPKQGEKITLLNGKEIEPRSEAIIIASDKQPIGIGGVMGGGDTEVDENTKNIIIESANFNMYSIRRTSMVHGLFTDAVTRFNKGQSPLQNLTVLAKITDEVRRFANGKVASHLIDDNHLPAEVVERGALFPAVHVSGRFINERLGLELSAQEMKALLENVEFTVEEHEGNLTVLAPFWRTDIEIPEDVVEEVGRLYGFDHLPLELPRRSLRPVQKDHGFELKAKLRTVLAKAGANELLTYSFIHGDLLTKVGQDASQAFQLSNALSPELQYYRLSLMPSLLEKVHSNLKAGYDQFAMFELGKAHSTKALSSEGMPVEGEQLALVFAAGPKSDLARTGAAFYQARNYIADLLNVYGLSDATILKPLTELSLGEDQALNMQMIKPFEPSRSVAIMKNDQFFGVIGEYRKGVQKALKLPDFCAGFEVLDTLFDGGLGSRYVQLPRFPSVAQDICFKVPIALAYQELFDFIRQQLDEIKPEHTRSTLSPVDIYRREEDTGHKQVTLRLQIASYERTMTDREVNKVLHEVADKVSEKFGAAVV